MVDIFLPPRYPRDGLLNLEIDSFLVNMRTSNPDSVPTYVERDDERIRRERLETVVDSYLADTLDEIKRNNFECVCARQDSWIRDMLDQVYERIVSDNQSLSEVFGTLMQDNTSTCDCYHYFFLLQKYYPNLTKDEMDAIWRFSAKTESKQNPQTLSFHDFKEALHPQGGTSQSYTDREVRKAMILSLERQKSRALRAE